MNAIIIPNYLINAIKMRQLGQKTNREIIFYCGCFVGKMR